MTDVRHLTLFIYSYNLYGCDGVKFLDTGQFYCVPFSHLFTELQISPIELEISANTVYL